MKTSQGVSRRFAYIGYKTEKEAKAALKYFNDTFIDTSKITVEKAKAIGDPSLPRPWSMHSLGSTAHARLHKLPIPSSKTTAHIEAQTDRKAERDAEFQRNLEKKKEHMRLLFEGETNEKLKEFLDVMGSGPRKGRTWANDDSLPAIQLNKKAAPKVEAVAVANKKTGGQGQLLTKVHVKFEDSDNEEDEYEELPKAKEQAEEPVQSEQVQNEAAKDDALTDAEYLKSRMTLMDDSSDEERDDEKAEEAAADSEQLPQGDATPNDNPDDTNHLSNSSSTPFKPTPVPEPSETLSPEEQIQDTGRLFVRNLPYTCEEKDLRKLFEKFGMLSEIHMPIAKDTKAPKGYAYILYLMPEHALKAYKALDSQSFQGRLLHILPAKEKPQKQEEELPTGSIKTQKEKMRKAARGSEFNWNTLYMNQDAIADSISARLNIPKSELLNPHADNQAVRLALAETQLVAETKEYLEQHGIQLEQFGKKERSDTVILVKNIPYGTSEEELRELFGRHGDIGRILIPSARTLAIVEFLEPTEARSAFSHLAYKRYKDTLLYLEKAPVGIFEKPFDKENPSGKVTIEAPMKAADLLTSAPAEEEEDTAQVATLFVKNLNFSTTERKLQELFQAVPGYRTARVRTKPDPKKPGGKLSMGFGFVEFKDHDTAQNALNAMKGTVLDDHVLDIKFSHRQAADEPSERKTKANKSTKLVVRNVPFEATKKDLRELFGSYGHLKSLRLPSKFSGGHRGFAFLDFLTHQEAENVYKQMSSIHLYGRHLVLEWAQDVEGVEALREKTGRGYVAEEENDKKRRRVNLDGEEDEE